MGRVDYDSELIEYIRNFVSFYDQQKHKYLENPVEASHEIVSCIGNISVKEGGTFVHAHVVLDSQEGNAKAGHLLEARVFAAGVHVLELLGEVKRESDEVRGLSLWNI